MPKRKAIDAFFKPAAPKKPNVSALPSRTEAPVPDAPPSDASPATHATYPFAQPHLPPHLLDGLARIPTRDGAPVADRPDLDLLSFAPLIPRAPADALFAWLRRALFFYRVTYSIQRGPTRTEIRTPRYTTVFGVDATAGFAPDGTLVDARTRKPVPASRYPGGCRPRPLPPALDVLRTWVEACTDQTFNFCLVNYYASSADSISWHSDDERFLGPQPAIASLSLGAKRDFCMKHKPLPKHASQGTGAPGQEKGEKEETLKFAMGAGDMLLMRGRTQAHWLHSVPKRKGDEAERGRINITFRKALVPEGTGNYYRYNVGDGAVWRWNEEKGEMMLWDGQAS